MSIAVNDLSFSYCTRTVLQNVSFEVGNGSLLAVLGPNGVGKTTLFRCILGMYRRYGGKIFMDGADVRTLSAREIAHRVAYIPQLHGQAFAYSATDMVLMGTTHGISPMSSPKAKEQAAAEAAMERVGILHIREKNFSHLSGGEQQLVLIARALAQNTSMLLMDEPTASLDYGNQSMVLRQARELADDGYTVVLSTHNPQHALWYADSALALLDGRVAAFGPPGEMITSELILRLFGVQTDFIRTEDGTLIAPSQRKGGGDV